MLHADTLTGTSAMTPNGSLIKRSMRIAGHRTSLALEHEFWSVLEKIARARDASLPVLIASIDDIRARESPNASLASAVRVFVLENRP
jgi:predicted DNA-binding ribbon-helix-helix protein